MSQIDLLKRRLERERNARLQAEDLLEKKSLELYKLNQTLEEQNRALQVEIEDRKNTEKILEEKTTLLDSLFTNSVELSIATTDLDMRITYFNSVAEKLFHYKAEEVVGKTVHEIHLMEHVAPERLTAAIRQVENSGEYKYQVVQETDGQTQIVNSRVTAIRGPGGKMTGYVLFSQDVTEKTLIEERLKLQSVALESAADAIGITDRDGNVVWVNSAFTDLTGYHKEEMLGQNLRILNSGSQEKPFYADLWGTISSGQVWKNEIINRHKKGYLYHEEISITPVKNAQGEIVNYITIKRDISLRKEAERELKESKEAAESANFAKSKFLANMSHEIRTPLNGLISMLNLLDESALNIRQRDYLDMAMVSVESLLGIINDILDFSKIEAGMLTLDPKPFHLEYELGRAVGLFAAKAEKSGIELIFGFDPNLPQVVVADLIRIKQILNNLVHNALKFTQHGYIWVQIQGRDIGAESVGLEIRVQDTGIGIPEAKQSSIFEYFTQADTSTTRKFGGTGLGLSICTLLTKLMGGTIKLDSCPGEGSTFTVAITLPISKSVGSVAQPNPSCLVTQKVLILDDNPITLNLFSNYLSFYNINHQTFQAADAAFAAIKVAQAANDSFDIVIVDHSLPEITGAEFKDQVLSHRHLQDTKMILMAPMGVINQNECDCHGFCACIPKPVSMSDFMMFLEMVASPDNRTMVTMDMLHRQASKKELMENAVEKVDLKILLVEDNTINQIAAKEILKKIGFSSIEIVGNGQEALNLLKRKKFDLVFMDIQMPVMDGLEATRRIREWELRATGSKHHLPIIAMTANAIDGDRDECLDAGMDDYISKPFRKELFIDLLRKWVDKIKASSGQISENDVVPVVKRESLAFNYQDILDRYDGDRDIIDLIVDMFIQQTPEMIAEIKEHILQNRIHAIAAVAHSLKGAAANVGADRIVELAKDMEKVVSSTTIGTANQFLLALENEFAEFQDELKTIFSLRGKK